LTWGAVAQTHLLGELPGIGLAQQVALDAAVQAGGGHVPLQGPQPVQHGFRLIGVGLQLQ